MNVQCYLNNVEIDISKDFPMPLNFSIDDVRKIEKKNGNYSKTLIIPGTKLNNKLFGNLFDVNQDFTFFNPNIKTPFRIEKNGVTQIDGVLQLREIKVLKNKDYEGDEIQYHCVVKDEVIDYYSKLKEQELSSLDLSNLDHIYSYDNIVNSWTHSYTDGYVYPMTYKGEEDYNVNDFSPAIYHRYYLEKMSNNIGFKVGGSFFENTEYNKEIIPYNGDWPRLSDSEVTRRTFEVGSIDDTLMTIGTYSGNSAQGSFDTGFQPVDFYNRNVFNLNNHWNISTNTYKADALGRYDILGKINLDILWDSKGVEAYAWWRNFNVPVSENGFPAGLPYRFEMKAKKNGSYLNNGMPILSKDIASFPAQIPIGASEFLEYLLCGPKPTFHNRPSPPPGCSGGWNWNARVYNGDDFKWTDNKVINFELYDQLLEEDDEITFEWRLVTGYSTPTQTIYSTNYINYSSSPTSNLSDVDVEYSFRVKEDISLIKNVPVASKADEGDTLEMNRYIPKLVKQSDLIDDIVQRYNLYIRVNPDDNTEMLFDTRDDFYFNGAILDYTDKKDYSKEDTIELLSELQSKEIHFAYKQDKDTWNSIYENSSSGDTYGIKKIEFNNDFTKGVKLIGTKFSPTPLVYSSFNADKIVPAIPIDQPNQNIRVIYYGGLIDTLNGSSWDFDYADLSVNITNTTLMQIDESDGAGSGFEAADSPGKTRVIVKNSYLTPFTNEVSDGVRVQINNTTIYSNKVYTVSNVTYIDNMSNTYLTFEISEPYQADTSVGPTFQVVQGAPVTTTYTQYPYAGHYLPNPILPTLDNNYGERPYEFYNEIITTTPNTLYNLYWRNYIESITDGRMLTCYLNLYENDIYFLSRNLNTRLFIRDSYYIINKIIDYNPMIDSPTKVELIKMKVFHGIRYKDKIKPIELETQPYTQTYRARPGYLSPDLTLRANNLILTTGTDHNVILSPGVICSGNSNYVGKNCTNINISGDNIVVSDNVSNCNITGTNIKVYAGLSNITVMGSVDKEISTSDTSFVGEMKIVDGIVSTDNSNFNTGRWSLVQGTGGINSGINALLGGDLNNNSGNNAVVYGLGNWNTGDRTSMMGFGNTGSAINSGHFGDRNINTGDNSGVFGLFNENNGDNSLIIGAGLTNNNHNTLVTADFSIKKDHLVPTTATSSVGQVGSITWDNNNLYVRTNEWKYCQLTSVGDTPPSGITETTMVLSSDFTSTTQATLFTFSCTSGLYDISGNIRGSIFSGDNDIEVQFSGTSSQFSMLRVYGGINSFDSSLVNGVVTYLGLSEDKPISGGPHDIVETISGKINVTTAGTLTFLGTVDSGGDYKSGSYITIKKLN